MVDILDMENIFITIIVKNLNVSLQKIIPAQFITDMSITIGSKLIKEVSDFVEGQQTIECANCKGYKFKNLKSWNR